MRGGIKRHRTSGISHNHAHSINRVRDENNRLDKEAKLKAKRKGVMKDSVKELFSNFN